MTLPRFASLTFCAHLASGCAVSVAKDAPAVIENPTSQSRQVLVRAVSELLGHEVLLADDAFTTSDRLIVEPSRARDPQGTPVQGREVRPPVQLLLIKSGQLCAVMRADSGKRVQLAGVQCRDFN